MTNPDSWNADEIRNAILAEKERDYNPLSKESPVVILPSKRSLRSSGFVKEVRMLRTRDAIIN